MTRPPEPNPEFVPLVFVLNVRIPEKAVARYLFDQWFDLKALEWADTREAAMAGFAAGWALREAFTGRDGAVNDTLARLAANQAQYAAEADLATDPHKASGIGWPGP